MPVDKNLVTRKITFINRDLKMLLKLSNFSFPEYLKKPEYEAAAERFLERVVGRMIDINYHILAEGKQYTPIDYYNSFVDMGEMGYLDKKFSKKIADAAGLRNRLTHEYDKIDEKKIYKAIKTSLGDVPKYLTQIDKLLGKGSKQNKLI